MEVSLSVTWATAFFLDSGSFLLTSTDWLNSSRAETRTNRKTVTQEQKSEPEPKGGVWSKAAMEARQEVPKQAESRLEAKGVSHLYIFGTSLHTFIFLDPSITNITLGCLSDWWIAHCPVLIQTLYKLQVCLT